MNGVVPVPMKLVWSKKHGLQIGIRYLDAEWVGTRIELRVDRQAGGGANVPNELHDRLMIDQWSAAPVFGDVAKESVLDFVPLGSAGRKVRDADGETAVIGEPLQLPLPEAGARTVAAARVSGD